MTRSRFRVVVAAAFLAVAAPAAAGRAAECPDGAAGLACAARDVRVRACECDGATLRRCRGACAAAWGRVRATLRRLVKAQQRGRTAKIAANLPKIDRDLGKIRARIATLVDRYGAPADCAEAAGALLDELAGRVAEAFGPGAGGGTATTTTTLPGGGALHGAGTLSPFGLPDEVIYEVGFTGPVTGFAIYVPGRSIVGDTPNGVTSCTVTSRTADGDTTPDNYYQCAGSVGAGMQVTGSLRLAPEPVSGMPAFLYGFQSDVEFGPFGLASAF